MSLLDLPPELLRMILVQVSLASRRHGLRALFPIRATCRVLRDEANEVLFFESPVMSFRRYRCIAAINGHTAVFLFNKLHKPMDARPELPALVNKMTDFLCDTLSIAEEDKRSCQWRICKGIVKYFGAKLITDLLISRSEVKDAKLPAHDSPELMDRYKVLAAVLGSAPHLVDDLWGGLLRDGPLFNKKYDATTPLVQAVKYRDTALFDSIIKYCRTISPINAESVFDMHKAFGLALDRSRIDFAREIASISPPYIRESLEFGQWLALVIPLRNMEVFDVILRQRPGNVQRRHLDMALKFGTLEMVKALFKASEIKDVNDMGYTARRGEAYIETACGGGNIEVIQGLINAGAELPDTALPRALKNNKWKTFVYLLNLGYPLPDMDKWPRKCSKGMYDKLCAMKVEDGVEQSLLPAYDKFKGMSWQALRKLEASFDLDSMEE